MPTPSNPPPNTGGGNAKYVVFGLLLLGGAAGLFVISQPEAPPPAPAPKPAELARVNPLAKQQLILEDDEPDAGVDAAVAEEAPKPKAKKRKFAKRGEWDCGGDLSGAASVIGRNRAQVRTCYERRLKVNNILQGNIKLKLKIGASGSVSNVNVSGSLRDNEVFACVRKLAKTWKFKAPTGGNCAVVQVPYKFAPKI